MIFFGHLGITTGAFKTYEKLTNEDLKNKISIDYRFVFIGSILPDIIDKPIGAYLFRSTFHNSRIFAHTLLFCILLILIGIYKLYKHKNSNVLILGISSFIHLILDSMWLYAGILFWPCFGWTFPVRPEGNWLKSDVLRLITDPRYYLPELIGFIIIVYYFIKLVKNGQVKAFITEGKL